MPQVTWSDALKQEDSLPLFPTAAKNVTSGQCKVLDACDTRAYSAQGRLDGDITDGRPNHMFHSSGNCC
jgi:hypothetical protein